MALLPNAVDVQNTPEMSSFEPIPAGKYLSKVIESQLKRTSAGNGQYLELKFVIMEGEYSNRNFWVRLNIDNPNQDAVKIANQELAAIGRAVGIYTKIGDSNQLHGKPMYTTLKIRPPKGEYGPSNAVGKYESAGAVTEVQQTSAPAQEGAPAQASQTASTPWD